MHTPSVGARCVKEAPVIAAARTLGCAIAVALVSQCLAAPPNLDSANEAVGKPVRVGELKVRVVDPDGHPVAQAKVSPWGLRCSLGHDHWAKDTWACDLSPTATWTDATGIATVAYPYYCVRAEQIRTTEVSLKVDHPDFAYTSDVFVAVPPATQEPHEIKLPPGVPLEVRPMLDGKVASHDNLFIICSEHRSYERDFKPRISAEGTLGIPAARPGANSVLLVTLDGDRATHFSRITDFDLVIGEPKQLEVELRPGVCVRGTLSENVPRPVRNGRVNAHSLQPADNGSFYQRVLWVTWVPIEPDGTFVIDTWPADEPIQLIALCEGFIAANGTAPEEVRDPPVPPKVDPFGRPQVFRSSTDGRIELAMTPLVRCNVTAVDPDDKPVAGVEVGASPSVGWWNDGAQPYCHPLVRGERMVRVRDFNDGLDNVFPNPWSASTDEHGKATLELPSGRQFLQIVSDAYELPILRAAPGSGMSDAHVVDVWLHSGKPTGATLDLQPRGTEKLGDPP